MNLGELFQVTSGLEGAVVRIALVLMHSLWQVLLVVNVVAILSVALARAKPHVRYTVALVGLLALPVFPLVTWFVVEPTPRPDAALALAATVESEMNLAREGVPSSETTFDKVTRLAGGIDSYCRQHATWLAAAWGMGVVAFAVRFFVAWISVWKLHRVASETVPHGLTDTLQRLMKALAMSSPIRLSITDAVDSPAVVGWFRPLILLPAHVMTGLKTEDLTHILAHELAHVRRHDYAVNLAQCVIEMLFFHHPAVWWLSHQVREEREHCCDEIAIAVCGDRFAYARSLATLDDMRPEPRPLVLALGTKGGRLMNRIRRLLGVPTPSIGGSGAIVLAGMALIVVIALALGANDATAQTEEKPGETKTEETEERVVEELDALILLEVQQQQQLAQAQLAQVQAASEQQSAQAAADIAKAAAQTALQEQKFKLAELELALEEAKAMETIADEEAAVFETLMQAGQTSQLSVIERKKVQMAARMAKRKAELALKALQTGQDPSAAADELEIENATIALKAAEDAVEMVEKRAAEGQASAIDRSAARRDAIKAKFHVDRLRLKQQYLKQYGDERAAESAVAKVAEVGGLTDALAKVVEKQRRADAEQPTIKVYKLKSGQANEAREILDKTIGAEKGSPLHVEVDEQTNTIIVRGTSPIHKEVAQMIAQMEKGPGHPDWENLKSIFEGKHGSEEWNSRVKKIIAGEAEIDRPTLIRRLSLDLRGTLPGPEEVKAFVTDPGPDAVRRLVTRLLEGAKEGASDESAQYYKLRKTQKTAKTPQAKGQSPDDAESAARAADAKIAKTQADIDVQLLELDLQQAENDLIASQGKVRGMNALNAKNKNAVDSTEVIAAQMEVANSEIAVRRARLKLEAAKLKQTPAEGKVNPAEGAERQ